MGAIFVPRHFLQTWVLAWDRKQMLSYGLVFSFIFAKWLPGHLHRSGHLTQNTTYIWYMINKDKESGAKLELTHTCVCIMPPLSVLMSHMYFKGSTWASSSYCVTNKVHDNY